MSREDIKSASYNAVNDLIVLSRICHTQAVFDNDEEIQGKIKVFFLTFDKSLEFFLEQIVVENVQFNSNGIMRTTASFDKLLFDSLGMCLKQLPEKYVLE